MFGETVGTVLLVSGTVGRYVISSVNQTTGVTITPPVRIFHITLSSGTASAGSTLKIYNGQGGNLEIVVSGTNIGTTDVDYGVFGHTFPNGAFAVPADTNSVSTAIICKADLL